MKKQPKQPKQPVPVPAGVKATETLKAGPAPTPASFYRGFQEADLAGAVLKAVEVTPLGRKDDAGKIRLDLLPLDALTAVGDVLTDGATRYGDRNWEAGMAWHRLFGALLRHTWAWWQGEGKDPDSRRSHLAHAACCVLFLLAYEIRGAGTDDRPRT